MTIIKNSFIFNYLLFFSDKKKVQSPKGSLYFSPNMGFFSY